MLVSILVVFAVILAVFAILFRTLLRREHPSSFDPLEWLADFSTDSYRPMERLLDGRDYTFLASQPGYEPSIARDLRRQRMAIYHSYLSGLIRDFHRLMKIARVVTAYATTDSMQFETALWRLRLRFYWSIACVEAQIAMNALGIGEVDARRLLGTLERVQVYTLRICPSLEA